MKHNKQRLLDLSSVLLIMLIVNVLNGPNKMQILSDWVKKKGKPIYVSYEKFKY